MRVSSKSRYALLTVLDLTVHRQAGVIKMQDIARRQEIPHKFLEQILLGLKAGGIVVSRRGAKGGYLLAREPRDISVADVLRLTDASLLSVQLDDGLETEKVFSELWASLNETLTRRLESMNFEEVAERSEELRAPQALEYSI